MTLFRIGDFSQICRVPVSALRYYADIGLLAPAHINPGNGFRFYTIEQLPRLSRILALKDLGLSLDEIRLVLQEALSAEQIRGMLALKQAELQSQVTEAQARLARVEARLNFIIREGAMPEQDVVLKPIAAMTGMTIRRTVPQPQDVGQLLGASCAAIMQSGATIVGPPLTIFHDPEFRPADLDIEVVVPVAPGAAGAIPLDDAGDLTLRELPPIAQAAVLMHIGTYATLDETYATIGRWIAESGYQIAGPSREVYLSAPDEQGNAATEIQFPVERA